MERNVIEFEPEKALFVKDEDPLLFYRTIAEKGCVLLRTGGRLFFEINRRFGEATKSLLESKEYRDVELRKDSFGNDRMMSARWK